MSSEESGWAGVFVAEGATASGGRHPSRLANFTRVHVHVVSSELRSLQKAHSVPDLSEPPCEANIEVIGPCPFPASHSDWHRFHPIFSPRALPVS